MKEINKINNLLSNDVLPDALNYSKPNYSRFDWSKLYYDPHSDPDNYIKKFPVGFMSLPGADKIINSMIDDAKLINNPLTPNISLSLDSLEIKE
jgi:hypothetical protein